MTSFQSVQEITIEQFAQFQHEEYKIITPDKSKYLTHLLDRLQLHSKKIEVAMKAKKAHSNKNSYDKTVYTRIHIWQFDFDTTEKRLQATDSLLSCFPSECVEINPQTSKTIKITPSIWIFTDQSIFIAKTACEQVDQKWTNFKSEFADTFAAKDSAIIVTECGKLTWTTKEKLKNAP